MLFELFEPLTNKLKPVVATSVQYFGIFAGYRVLCLVFQVKLCL